MGVKHIRGQTGGLARTEIPCAPIQQRKTGFDGVCRQGMASLRAACRVVRATPLRVTHWEGFEQKVLLRLKGLTLQFLHGQVVSENALIFRALIVIFLFFGSQSQTNLQQDPYFWVKLSDNLSKSWFHYLQHVFIHRPSHEVRAFRPHSNLTRLQRLGDPGHSYLSTSMIAHRLYTQHNIPQGAVSFLMGEKLVLSVFEFEAMKGRQRPSPFTIFWGLHQDARRQSRKGSEINKGAYQLTIVALQAAIWWSCVHATTMNTAT